MIFLRIDTPKAVQAICNVLHGNSPLIQAFKPVLNEGHDFQLLDSFHDTHCLRVSSSTEPDTFRAAFGLIKSPKVKPTVLPSVSTKMLHLLDNVVTSPVYQSAVITLQGGDAMQAMELMQKVIFVHLRDYLLTTLFAAT